MINRLTTGWTIQRGLFVLIGSILIIQSVLDNQWLGVAFGAYFASMGLFAFGCASGNCYGSSCNTKSLDKNVDV